MKCGVEGTYRTLQRRVVELLSNSAQASGIGLPIEWNPDFADPYMDTFPMFEEYSSWWQANADRITLHDPWLEMLAARKID